MLDKPRQEKPALRFSQTRLKVRNIDKGIVTNDDIRVSAHLKSDMW